MRAIDRTCQLFVRSVAEALPETRINIVRSRNSHGQSRYVYIHLAGRMCADSFKHVAQADAIAIMLSRQHWSAADKDGGYIQPGGGHQ